MPSKIEQDRQCPQIPDREEELGPVVFRLFLSHDIKWFIVGLVCFGACLDLSEGKLYATRGRIFKIKWIHVPVMREI